MNTISWVAPASNGSAITGYTVQFSKADASGDYGSFSDLAGCENITSTTCTHSNLMGGDRYKYQVKATNGVGDTNWSVSDEIVVASSAPSVPGNVAASSYRGVNTFSWSLSASNGSVITGYEAEFAQKDLSTDTYGAWASIPGCSSSDPALITCSHSGLTKDDVYKYQVRATFSGGGSPWAETTDTTVLAGVPATVSSITVTSSNGVNTVSWVAPASHGSSITGYTVEFVQKTSGVWGQTWQQACTGGALDTSCEHTGLSQGDEYKYRIIATNGEGSSPASSESLEQAVVAGTPEAPVFLSLSSRDGTNDISWSAPAANGSPITGYTLQYSKLDASGDLGIFYNVPGCSHIPSTSCTHGGLIGGDRYKYDLRATNIVGHSAWVTSDELTVHSSLPLAPTNAQGVSSAGVNTLTWEGSLPRGSVISGYEVEFNKQDASPDTWALVPGCSTTEATLRQCLHLGLTKDDVYSYRIRAVTVSGNSAWAQVDDLTVLATAPSAISKPSVATGSGANTISWVAPASNGSAITGYTVQFSKADASGDYGSFSDVAGCVDIVLTTCMHSGLIGGDRYKYQVQATNEMGSTPWSISDEVAVNSLAPSAPTNMTATSAQGVNTISWSLSVSNGSVITGYEVQFAQKDLSNDNYAPWALSQVAPHLMRR